MTLETHYLHGEPAWRLVDLARALSRPGRPVSPDHLLYQLRRWRPDAVAGEYVYAEGLGALVERIRSRDVIAPIVELLVQRAGAARWTIARRVERVLHEVWSDDELAAAGRRAAMAYRRRHGRDPELVEEDGRRVCAYRGRDLDLVDEALSAVLSARRVREGAA